jgi:type VI secretion system VasD/TssJ family lipoprotein
MKITFHCLFLAVSLSVLCSCFNKYEKGQPVVPYERETIVLSIKSDPQLNLYQDRPHTLALCVYQLKDPNAFNQVADEKGGLEKLVECNNFNPSVLYSNRIYLQPSQQMRDVKDKAEGTSFIGIVAGYYYPTRDKITRIYKLPPLNKKNKLKVYTVDINLGQTQIQ